MALSFLDVAMPYFNRMHEMTVDHTHEEIQLLAIDFSTMLFETTAPMPMWRDAYRARDQRPSYAYLRRVLQVLQWLRGGTRWVLKSPQHLEQFPALRRHLPRRHLRRHPPRPRVGDDLDGDDARLHVPPDPRPRGRRGHRPLLGRPPGAACCAAAPTSVTSCRQTRPSTCTSTSSWPTTWPWSARVYELAGQPLDDTARSRHGRLHGGAPTGQVRRRRVRPAPSSVSTRRRCAGRCPSTPSASA